MSDAELQREYTAATEGAGVHRMAAWTTIVVTGRDRTAFLHNMCTNDVKALAAGAGCEAFFTDVKGKVLAHAFILIGEAAIQLITVPGQAARLVAHLDRYIIREDVQLADATHDVHWLLVSGRHAGIALAPFGAVQVAGLSAPWAHAAVEFNAIGVQIARCNLPWCGGYLVGTAKEHLDVIGTRLAEAGAADCSQNIWHAIRVESAWPLWGVDFDDSSLPQEVNRDALAISFRKGCYLGQETVARIDALGHVNKKLVQVRFSGDALPRVGAELTAAGQPVGNVTSAAWSPRWRTPVVLALVRRGANDAGQALHCNRLTGEVGSDNAG